MLGSPLETDGEGRKRKTKKKLGDRREEGEEL